MTDLGRDALVREEKKYILRTIGALALMVLGAAILLQPSEDKVIPYLLGGASMTIGVLFFWRTLRSSEEK